ncbi:MAG: MFS transporter [Dehalococcoidia bacterium]
MLDLYNTGINDDGTPLHPDPQQPSHIPRTRLLGVWPLPFYYGWVIVAVVFVAEFVSAGVGTFAVPLFFKPMSEDLGWSLTLMTGAITAQGLVYAGISPFLGLVLDRFGARPVMFFGAIVAGAGLVLLGRIQEIWHFWLLYAGVGALGLHEMGGFTGPVLVTKWFVRLRGRAMAFATMGTTVGAMVMAPVLGYLITSRGWRDTWVIMGILVIVVVVPVTLLFIRRQPEDMGLQPDGALTGLEPVDEKQVSEQQNVPDEVSWSLKEAMRTRTLWIIVVAMNMVGLSASVVVIHLVPFLTLQQGISAQAASFVVSLRFAAASVSRLVWGFAADRFPIKHCLAVAFFSRAMHPLALILLPYPFNVAVLVATSVTGGGFQVLQPMAFANYYGRRHSGSILGAMRPILTVSSLIGPLFISVVYDFTGTFNFAFLLAGGLGVLSAGVVLLATPPQKKVEISL